MENKKYLLIKEFCGTEPYVNSRLEYDIKDVIEYSVIPREEMDEHDIIKILEQSDNENDLQERLKLLNEDNFYTSR